MKNLKPIEKILGVLLSLLVMFTAWTARNTQLMIVHLTAVEVSNDKDHEIFREDIKQIKGCTANQEIRIIKLEAIIPNNKNEEEER